MTKVLGSRKTFTDATDEEAIEFVDIVSDIIANDDFQKLKEFKHHVSNTRYQHCLNVAWYTYLWTKKASLNYRSATRGALLHDFFLYDYRHGGQPIPGRHIDVHPMVALANARKYFEVDEVMYDCIAHHMFPSSLTPPTTKEGVFVTLADKYCASLELGNAPVRRISPIIMKTMHALIES